MVINRKNIKTEKIDISKDTNDKIIYKTPEILMIDCDENECNKLKKKRI